MSIVAEFPAPVTVGVDTHSDTHTAVVLDARGGRVAVGQFCAAAAGYAELEAWAASFGTVVRFGVEGTGSWGAGLTAHLQAAGHVVIEVDQPDRKMRRNLGKSDPIDAEAAARAALAGTATTVPKDHTGNVECIRALHRARRSAVKARAEATNQLRSLITTAPEPLRAQLRDLTIGKLIGTCAAMKPGGFANPTTATKTALRSIARRYKSLTAEIAQLEEHLDQLVAETAPPELLESCGVGTNVAAQLLITVGDNHDRITGPAEFTRLVGTSPVPASSGRTNRHRLNRGGDRQANAAIHRIAIVRLAHDQRTKDYIARRMTEGKTKREAIRCVKNYIAREVYRALQPHLTT